MSPEGNRLEVTAAERRILVIANKSWEAEAVVHAFLSKTARPPLLKRVKVHYIAGAESAPPASPSPRLSAEYVVPLLAATRRTPDDADIDRCRFDIVPSVACGLVQLWCLEDWMPADANSSSTHAKWDTLKQIFSVSAASFGPFDVVIALGTANVPTAVSFNGCVTVGTRTFVHDPFGKLDPKKRFTRKRDGKTCEPMWEAPAGKLDVVLPSALRSDFFRNVSDGSRAAAEWRFLSPPAHPAQQPIVLAGTGFAAISSVNVTNYDDFVWVDPEARTIFHRNTKQHEIGSVETTHGVIRLAAEAATGNTPKFLYISGIVNSLGMFDMEVAPRLYAQNFVGAHNAGVALLWLLVELTAQVGLDPSPEPPPCA